MSSRVSDVVAQEERHATFTADCNTYDYTADQTEEICAEAPPEYFELRRQAGLDIDIV